MAEPTGLEPTIEPRPGSETPGAPAIVAPDVSDPLLEKFQSASKEDVVKAYRELERVLGRQSSEISDLKTKAEAQDAILEVIRQSRTSPQPEEVPFEKLLDEGKTKEAVLGLIRSELGSLAKNVQAIGLETRIQAMRQKYGQSFEETLPRMIDMAQKDPTLGNIQLEHLYRLARPEKPYVQTPSAPKPIPHVEAPGNVASDQSEVDRQALMAQARRSGSPEAWSKVLRSRVGAAYEGMFGT